MLARRPPFDALPPPSQAAMPGRLVKIGELSEMLGITRRAIRHYEQRGLVKTIRGMAGVRLFDEAARRRLEWIAKLRLTGIGLRDIEEILEARGGHGPQLQLTVRKLEGRAARLRAEIREIEAAAELMRASLDEGPTPVTGAGLV